MGAFSPADRHAVPRRNFPPIMPEAVFWGQGCRARNPLPPETCAELRSVDGQVAERSHSIAESGPSPSDSVCGLSWNGAFCSDLSDQTRTTARAREASEWSSHRCRAKESSVDFQKRPMQLFSYFSGCCRRNLLFWLPALSSLPFFGRCHLTKGETKPFW